jgi:hypothetical protein
MWHSTAAQQFRLKTYSKLGAQVYNGSFRVYPQWSQEAKSLVRIKPAEVDDILSKLEEKSEWEK